MDDDDLNERPPTSRAKERARGSVKEQGGVGGGRGRKSTGGGGGGGGGAKKLSKRDEALLVPPLYTTVDLDKYDDVELFGTQGLTDFKKDVFSADREVLRAVLTKNHKLLKKLTTDKAVYKNISTFSAPRSASLHMSALQYAIELDDVTAAGMLLKTHELDKELLAKAPKVSLPSHSTGKHTSAYSDYNRRAINASRGGKEGNKALVEDSDASKITTQEEANHLWDSTSTSLKMLTLHYPTGEWTNNYSMVYRLAYSARKGNYKFVAKVVETLSKNGGWGFNDLHYKVLSDSDEDLPAFRSVSAVKMASQTRVRPLHLAAINPNPKYLEAVWESAGNEWNDAKDANGYEPIHYAAACEGTGPLKFLLERKVSLFTRSKSRETPMIRALLAGREDNAILMLEHLSKEDEESVNKLVTERGPGSRQPIHYAAEEGCAKVIKKLLELGADRNSAAADKKTPLCYAAEHGHLDCVQALLDGGAKVDGADKLKKTPLIYAVKNGHTRVAALLVNNGANVNAYDTSENSVVHYAASYGWNSCLQLLSDAGADFWVRNSWGFVPLICALLKQRLSSSEFILEHDEKQRFLDFRDRQGCTMLFLQCKHSTDISQIQYLLEKGLSPDICDSEKEYPLQRLIVRASRAKESHSSSSEENGSFFEEAIRLLLKHGAQAHYDIERPNPADESASLRWQPLQLAMEGSLDSLFHMLLDEFGADPTATASDGSDAWTVAASLGSRGDRYLEALLKHHIKTHKGKKLELGARGGEKYKDNFFHIVARNSVKGSISPALVRQCVERCAHPSKLMNEKDNQGRSPLLVLLGQERSIQSRPSSSAELSDLLEEYKKSDAKYSELVALMTEFTTSADAFVRFVAKSELAGAVEEKAQVVEDEPESNVQHGGDSDNGSGSDNGSDYGSDNGSDDDSDAGSDDDSDDADSQTGVSSKKTRTRHKSAGDSPDAKLMVKFETALQLAANRKLTLGVTDVMRQWYGENLISILFEKKSQLFDAELLNFPDFTNNKTALQYAVEASDLESTRILVVNGADANLSPFRCEVCQGKLLVPSDEQCVSKCGTELIETALFTAVQKGHLEITKLLLSHGANVACFERKTLNTPLHSALGANNADITKELLAHGANLSKRNALGAAPLHFAVLARHSIPETELHQDEVKYTDLGTKSWVKSPMAGGQSAIQVALQDKRAVHAVVLKDSSSLTPMHLAAANRDLALLRDLIKACSDKATATNIKDDLGRTPLHYAVNKATMSSDASFEVERFLLQSGADANVVDDFGFSALHFALLKVDMDWQKTYDQNQHEKQSAQTEESQQDDGEYEVKKRQAFLEVLAKIPSGETDPVETVSNLAAVRGVNVMLQDALGRSPLHLAAATGAFVCVSMLVSTCSKDVDKMRFLALKDNESFTALGQGVLHLRQTTIMTLLQNKADVRGTICIKTPQSETDANGDKQVKVRHYSYFYHAVKNSLTGICHMLLTAKFSHRQAIEDAVKCGQFQLAYNLMIGTEITNDMTLLTRLNARKENLLHTLAKVNKPFDKLARTIAWTLVDAGVDPRQRNEDGNTALHYAAKIGNIHVMDFLLHNKSDVNQANKVGETPLLYAMKKGKTLSQTKVVEVMKYLMAKPGFNLHAKDTSGMNILTAYLDRFTNIVDAETSHYTWFEHLLKKGVDPNGLFTSLARKDLFQNKALAETSRTVKMPALIRVLFSPSPFARFHSIALLLRYGAKITSADENGNSVLTHLVAKNLVRETKLVLGKIKRVPDPTVKREKKVFKPLHIAAGDVKTALSLKNRTGQTALHFAVKPFEFESFENTVLVKMLIDAGASVQAKDAGGKSVLEYTRGQSSRFLFRFLKKEFPSMVPTSEDAFFGDVTEDEYMFESTPDFAADAREYLLECEQSGKIKRTRIEPEVNVNCDVGKERRVYSKLDDAGELIKGEEYNALLTKVDVKNGRFGLNVFYRLQLVQDEIQGLFIVFTNWGRIGETGKFQNTPFHVAADAISEFKKIFRAKTGNHWDDRGAFVKQSKKYNLVQRVDTHTTVDKSVTASFTELAKDVAFPAFTDAESFPPSVVRLLGAITDIHNLELAATEGCNFNDSLPLAKEEELQAAVEKLVAIRGIIEERDEVNKEITQAGGNMTDESTAKLSELSDKYNALTETISEISSRYYEVMPCNEDAFGASIKAFDTVASVNTEITRLRLLMDIMTSYKMLLGAKRLQSMVHPLEYCYNAMQVQLKPMAPDAPETELLKKYFFNGLRSHAKTSYRVANAFHVNRQGEKARFAEFQDTHPTFKAQHSQLLWHGTRRTNLMGILSQGLRIAPPEAPHHGYMYGKGLYFADVTAKSVDYCGLPYRLKTTTVDKSGKSVETERNVFYMLLCEVSTGQATEAAGPTLYETIPEGLESVRALSKFVPDPEGSVVSPESGAKLHLGRVSQVGSRVPMSLVWAKTEYNRQPDSWYERQTSFSKDTQQVLDTAIEKLGVGESMAVDEESRRHFVYSSWQTTDKKVTIELVSKDNNEGDRSSSGDDGDDDDVGTYCDATVKVIFSNADAEPYHYTAKRYRNYLRGFPMERGFTVQMPNFADYSEFIVYNEAQARIRYLLEIEQV